MKKVSVLIACYNAEDYIKDCLQSLIVQTLDDYEIIIVDDGSTDRTVSIIHSVIDGVDNVTFSPRSHNLGTVKTRNELIGMARGRSEYIAWCDADDLYHIEKLKTQFNFLNKHPEYLGCGTWYKKFGTVRNKVLKFTLPEANKLFTCFGSPVGFPTFMLKNNTHVVFDESLDSGEDYAYLSELAKIGQITNIKRFLTYYRVHAKQESTFNFQRQRNAHNIVCQRISQFYLKDMEFLYPFINDPVINDVDSFYLFINIIRDLKQDKKNRILIALLDYRFLSYNKKKINLIMRFILIRNLDLLTLFKLYTR